MKIKAKTKDCRLVLKVKLSWKEEINEKELDLFARAYLRGFFKPSLHKKKLIEYVGPVGIRLQERLRKPITKRDFLFIIEQVVVAVQKLQAKGLLLDRVLWNLENVYMNEVTKEVQFIYLPLMSNGEKNDFVELMESIIYSALPVQEEDSECISRFAYYIQHLERLQADEIEKFIWKEDKSIVNTIKKQHAGQSGFMTSKQQHYYEHYAEKEDAEEATALLAEEEATDLLIEEEEATALLVEDEEERTGLLVENQACIQQMDYPRLIREQTGEEILINKAVFRLGKERSCVDYFISDNIAVSRSHADVITRGTCIFVKDLGSKNHTYINNQVLMPQCETEIHDGDMLKLGNEEFTFLV